MAKKRKLGAHTSASGKRARSDGTGREERQSGYDIKTRTDPTTGQQSAFPGLDETLQDTDLANANLFYGPAEDGLEYLRMVRTEAAAVPSMLIAPAKHDLASSRDHGVYENGKASGSGPSTTAFWSGEAIVADPTSEDGYACGTNWDDEEYGSNQEDVDPQDAFYGSLIARFHHLRESLRSCHANVSVQDQMSGEDDSQTSPDALSLASVATPQSTWYRVFSYTRPTTKLVVGLPHSSVMLSLERLELLLTRRNIEDAQRRANMGAWIWSLLAQCRDVGQLNGEEIGLLRTIAKTSSRLEKKFRSQAAQTTRSVMTDENDEDQEEPHEPQADVIESDHDGELQGEIVETAESADQLAAARSRLLEMVSSGSGPDAQGDETSVTSQLMPVLMLLDSIVTIVGQVYGQRDLLEQRSAW